MSGSKAPQEVDEQFESERRIEIVSALNIILSKLAMPLYLAFSLADFLYLPDLAWKFLPLRASVIPIAIVFHSKTKKAWKTSHASQLALLVTVFYSGIINTMILWQGEPTTAYYAGLNLVALGTVCFLPWSIPQSLLGLTIVFGPYIGFAIIKCTLGRSWAGFIVNFFFMFGTALISLMIRHFNNKLRMREFEHRRGLAKELALRDSLVQQKTKETVQLKELSRQFSPQIIHAISSGKINLNASVHRSNICAIFIDIVNSTQRITRIDKDAINKTISRFMDDSMKILVKYDLTIDKFLGDGILAFANDPMSHPDYIERTLMAGFEIIECIKAARDFYVEYWMNELQVRIGISSGYANVGFYGTNEVFKTYTAIGPVMNLASRLCSAAEPNSIVVSGDIQRKCSDTENFAFSRLGDLSLKGFEEDLILAYKVSENMRAAIGPTGASQKCPTCSGIMHLDVDAKGIYIFRCRNCDMESAKTKKSA